jgi:hypothetical protein
MKKDVRITQVKHDPAHCLAPGLFQSLNRGDRKGRNLNITYSYNKTQSLRFVGFSPLGAEELRLLQGIVALAGFSKSVLHLDAPKTDGEKQLALLIDPKHEALKEYSLVIRTSLQRLMYEIGYRTDGGEKRKDIKESLLRLSNVTVRITNGKDEQTYNLLGYYHDQESGNMVIGINPRITKAIMGNTGYTHIDMREVRALSSDAARLLHQRLSAVVNPGGQQNFLVDTLVSYIWPEITTGSTLRWRRLTLRKALAELEATGGWLPTQSADGCYVIHRRKVGYENQGRQAKEEAAVA